MRKTQLQKLQKKRICGRRIRSGGANQGDVSLTQTQNLSMKQ